MNKVVTGIASMHKPKGGRGIKAPYKSVIIRVPLPLASSVKTMIDDYRELLDKGDITNDVLPYGYNQLLGCSKIKKSEAIAKAKDILKSKKSARISLLKLLQLLYDDSNIIL